MLSTKIFFCWAFFWIIGLHYFQQSIGLGLGLTLNSIAWIFAALFISFICFYLCSRKKFKFNKTCLYFIITFIALNIPYVYPFIASDSSLQLTSESFGRFCGLLAGLLFFLVLSQLPKTSTAKKQLIDCVLIGTLIESLIILVQFFFLDSNSLIYFNEKSRPYGVFAQVNVAASFFATGLALSLHRLYLRKELKEESWISLCFILVCTILTSASIILTGSRTGLVSIIFILLIGIYASYRYNTKQIGLKWAGCVILGISIAYSSLSLQSKSIEPLVSVTQPGLRSSFYINCYNMIKEHPIKGWGYGNFKWVYLNYSVSDKGVEKTVPESIRPVTILGHPHNELLYWGVEGGLLPVFAIIAFALYFLLQLKNAQYSIILFLTCFPLTLHSLLEYPFYHSAPSWLLFLFTIWLGDRAKAKYKKVYSPFIVKSLATIICFLTIIFMITNLQAIYLYNKFEQTNDRSYLAQALNPIGVLDNYTYHYFILDYHNTLKLNTKDTTDNFINSIKESIPYNPQPGHFHRIIHLLLNEGRSLEADEMIEEHNRLFPLHKIFIDDIYIKEIHSNKIIAKISRPPSQQPTD